MTTPDSASEMLGEQDSLGLGVGLRTVHFSSILEHWPTVDWFKIISENVVHCGGRPRYVLHQMADRYPIVMHGVSRTGYTPSCCSDWFA